MRESSVTQRSECANKLSSSSTSHFIFLTSTVTTKGQGGTHACTLKPWFITFGGTDMQLDRSHVSAASLQSIHRHARTRDRRMSFSSRLSSRYRLHPSGEHNYADQTLARDHHRHNIGAHVASGPVCCSFTVILTRTDHNPTTFHDSTVVVLGLHLPSSVQWAHDWTNLHPLRYSQMKQ